MSILGDHVRVIHREEIDGLRVEILQYDELHGSNDPSISQHLYFAQKTGMALRQVRITLLNNDSEIVTEAGALQYFKGNIRAENKVGGFSGLASKIFGKKVNQESLFRPSYIGRGEVYLEPSFSNFLIITHSNVNDHLIMDKGMYYCSSSSMDIGINRVGNMSSAFLGSDGLFQTSVKGRGIVVVEIPVPWSEIREVTLNNETLKVDGTFALMRTGNVSYSVGLANKGLIKSFFSGEGLVETFTGTGKVWLAPTRDSYLGISELIHPVIGNTGSNQNYNNNDDFYG